MLRRSRDVGPLGDGSGIARRMVPSVRLDAYLALLGSIRWPHHALVLHHLDDLGRSVVADPELALKPGGGTSLRLRNNPDGLVEARIERFVLACGFFFVVVRAQNVVLVHR